jgi:hypothetical protein
MRNPPPNRLAARDHARSNQLQQIVNAPSPGANYASNQQPPTVTRTTARVAHAQAKRGDGRNA